MERVKIAFVIPGVPIAQPRQRSRVACINGHTVTQNYTPTKHPVNTFKAAAKMAAEAAYCGEPLSAPLDVAKRLRAEKGKTLRDVAAVWGMSTSYVSAVERGTREPPSLRLTFRMLDEFGAPELIGPFTAAAPILWLKVPAHHLTVEIAMLFADACERDLIGEVEATGIAVILAKARARHKAPPPFCWRQQKGPNTHARTCSTTARSRSSPTRSR